MPFLFAGTCRYVLSTGQPLPLTSRCVRCCTMLHGHGVYSVRRVGSLRSQLRRDRRVNLRLQTGVRPQIEKGERWASWTISCTFQKMKRLAIVASRFPFQGASFTGSGLLASSDIRELE